MYNIKQYILCTFVYKLISKHNSIKNIKYLGTSWDNLRINLTEEI